MNHLEKKWKKLDNGKGGEDATKAGKSLSRADAASVIEVCLLWYMICDVPVMHHSYSQ